MVAGSGTSSGSGIGVVSNTGIIGVSKETGEDVTGGSGLEATLPPFLSLFFPTSDKQKRPYQNHNRRSY